MKQLGLLIVLCLILVSCTNNVQEIVSNVSSDTTSSEVVSDTISDVISDVVSEEVIIPQNLKEIANTIAKEFKMRDLVDADEMVLEGMTAISPQMYDNFAGKVSYALDHCDTIFVLFSSTTDGCENLKTLLEEAKNKASQLYLDKIKEDVENSIIISQNGYVVWIVADDLSKANEFISSLLG